MNIILDNLTVSYQARPAVHHVHMTFEKGCMYAIFGPNGAGKSTLLKAMMGLLPCNTGSVQWQGLQRRDIAYLPQQSDIDRSQPMNVFELAAMGLWYEIGSFGRVSAAQKQRVQAALERVEMWDLADRGIGALSNGQFQRVLLARMLVQDAQFLLLDEPASGLDPEARYELSQLLLRLKSEGMTILVSSHILSELDEYCTHMLVMQRGRIKAHQAIHTENQNEQTLKIHLLQPPQDALARLRSLPNVQAASQQGDVFTVTLPQSDEMRAALLSDIVRAGLTLSSVSVVRTTLLENYQNSLNIHRENAQ